MTPIKLVAFDLDGTLVDSAPDIARAVDRMTHALGLPPPGFDKVRAWVGDGARRLVKRALTGEPEGEPDAALYRRGFEVFRCAYREQVAVESNLYPHALSTLRQLRAGRFKLACITNKSAEFTVPLLRALAIHECFDLVLSGDSLTARKPDPLPLRHAAEQLAVAPAAACMVGDSRNDILAARAAGFRAVAVRYGYGKDLTALGADAMLDSLAELPLLLEQWAAGLAPVPVSRYV
ncbi:MAG: phosphoglycolate phosphatase [Gammaproteobacteria bacterium]|nr:phosphoglycolate phosphatase [Gammaproteobacteria bacterium]